ncbi:hypothetical protein Pint_26135 [Pistacia integerrima]|uniref:Uncharacterized protein n=1 Tax=Pistacia integerrima TaxID=434235 RepID=A0ACC0YBI5_9ROSI|nr:hypothetical protein Pint_26135 [Pistacia integerrima]
MNYKHCAKQLTDLCEVVLFTAMEMDDMFTVGGTLRPILKTHLIFAISTGVHFKKWCVMQSKIKSGAVNEHKKELEVMLDLARAYVKARTSGGESNKPLPSPSSTVTQDL